MSTETLDVLLIVPPSPRVTMMEFDVKIRRIPPLGVGYLASVLRKNGFRAEVWNPFLGVRNIRGFLGLVEKASPRIIGFSTATENYMNGLRLARLCREASPEALIVFGGPHVTFQDVDALEQDCVDVVVRNEGEATILEIARSHCVKGSALSRIKGISYKVNGKPIRNTPRPSNAKLDELPYPVEEFHCLEDCSSLKPIMGITVSASRGCPYKCSFCAAGAMAGGSYRLRTPESVVTEIKTRLHGTEMREVMFADDTVTVDRERLRHLCRLLIKLDINWFCESRANILSQHSGLPKMMSEAGCQCIQIGIESGSQYILNSLKKGTTLETVERAVENCSEAGMQVVGAVMIGAPDDTSETIEATIEFAEHLQKTYGALVLLGCMTPFPGTHLFRNAKALGCHIRTSDFEEYFTTNPIMDTKYLNADQLRNIQFDSLLRLSKSVRKEVADNLMKLLPASQIELFPILNRHC